MAYSEAQKKANLKWRKANIKQTIIDLNKETDIDIIEKLDSVKNKSQYIKELIRNDIKVAEK